MSLKPLCSVSNLSPNRRQSLWASCEFCTHRRRDATRQLSRVGEGGVYWAVHLACCHFSWSGGWITGGPEYIQICWPPSVYVPADRFGDTGLNESTTHFSRRCTGSRFAAISNEEREGMFLFSGCQSFCSVTTHSSRDSFATSDAPDLWSYQ